jgi:hypothetical protein
LPLANPVEVFDAGAEKLSGIRVLARGGRCPDVIKPHHNVGVPASLRVTRGLTAVPFAAASWFARQRGDGAGLTWRGDA